MFSFKKQGLEDDDSWTGHLQRVGAAQEAHLHRRKLQGSNNKNITFDAKELERAKEAQFWAEYQEKQDIAMKLRLEERKEHAERLELLGASPGIRKGSVHGMMIDAGSSGSRLHIYEWEPRILLDEEDIQAAVSGEKISFPSTNTRWTERLHPGISTLGNVPDDQLVGAVIDYISPLIDFAKTVLHSKDNYFGDYPIFLRATAGMRMLNTTNRARVIGAIRTALFNKTFCPFRFRDENARVLSGEEEAIYGWAGVNFLLGNMLKESKGSGSVSNPKITHGALDLGGASTQISFFEPHEDIMSNLYKLQIGQAKHWNVYTHSFLMYGINEAIDRFQARLIAGKDSFERIAKGVYNPCLPGGATSLVRTSVHLRDDDVETWNYHGSYPSGDGSYQAILKNDQDRGDADNCLALAKDLLHVENNDWCDFANKEDCSFAGIYQPNLPIGSKNFGEFVAFANYHKVWKFLHLPERASLYQLENATRNVCSMSRDELVAFNDDVIAVEDLDSYCFRSAYVFQLLHNGYGFAMNDTLRVSKVINGHKVGWTLGAMLYEINTLPWHHEASALPASNSILTLVFALSFFVSLLAMYAYRKWRLRKLYKSQYEPVKDVWLEEETETDMSP